MLTARNLGSRRETGVEQPALSQAYMADQPFPGMSEQPKFYVKVYELAKPAKVPKEVQESLKGVASGKMMTRMKKEAIFCPVLVCERPFLECFACPNFMRRFKGEVHCSGPSLTSQ